DVELGGAAGAKAAREPAGEAADDPDEDQLPRRRCEPGKALILERLDHGPPEEEADDEPDERSQQGDDHRLPPDARAKLAPAHADGAQEPELARSLVDRERQRVGDPD